MRLPVLIGESNKLLSPKLRPAVRRLQAVLAAAGIARMYLRQGGHEMVVVTTMTLGRDDGNDIVLKDRMASRNHAQIERRKDKYVLIDLSSNGTYVRMENGDQIKLHREEMMLYGSGTITFVYRLQLSGHALATQAAIC